MYSSYEKNNYGRVFESIIKTHQPIVTVELGVLNGYSTVHIGKGLKFNREHFDISGHLDAYDLWDDYTYKHGSMKVVQNTINTMVLKDYITLHKADAYKVHEKYKRRSVHIVHIDISNTGGTIKKIVEQWNQKLVHNGILLFEGGSFERDNVEWMKKYYKPSIREEISTNKIIDQFYTVKIYEKFPSLTMLFKKKGKSI